MAYMMPTEYLLAAGALNSSNEHELLFFLFLFMEESGLEWAR